jgi:uncharacterized protein
VTSVYEAFGRGDVPAILGLLADDVRWDHGIRRTAVPYLVEGTGVGHVVGFFTALGEHLEIETFEVVSVASNGRDVFARIRIAGRHRPTGRPIPELPEVHHWVVDDDGHISAFTHIGDWSVHEWAASAAPAIAIA